MDGEDFYGASYKGSKQFKQQEVKTANATGFGAAADDYMERGIDLNEELIRNKPATFFFRMKGDAMQDAGIFDNELVSELGPGSDRWLRHSGSTVHRVRNTEAMPMNGRGFWQRVLEVHDERLAHSGADIRAR